MAAEYLVGAHYKHTATNSATSPTKVSPQVRAWEVSNLSAIKVHLSITGTAVATGVGCDTLLGIEGASLTIPCDNKALSVIRDAAEASNATLQIRELV